MEVDMATPGRTYATRSRLAPPETPILQIPSSPFMKRLGFGTGVDVYLIERSPKYGKMMSPWAVKKISKQCGRKQEVKRLKEEASILKGLCHKNIVGFRTFAKSSDGMYCLAMEVGEKSLFSMIEDRMEAGTTDPFPSWCIMKVATCVSSALSYLHNDRHLLHGDIKSGNVLVQGDFTTVKLCDFGVSLSLDDNLAVVDGDTNEYIGTPCWSAKEVLNGGVVTDRTDMFAFGITIYEMLTLAMPHMYVYPEEEDYKDEDEFEKDFADAEEKFDELLGTRPPLFDHQYDTSYNTCIEAYWVCTNEAPNERPSAQQLYDALSHYCNDDDVLPDPKGKLEF